MNTVTSGELGEQLAARLEIGNRSAFGDVERLEIGLAAFGLIPRSMKLRDNYPQSIAAGLAGVYDWHDKVLTLVTGPETLFGDAYSQRHGPVIAARIREGLLIHELTHAAQDQPDRRERALRLVTAGTGGAPPGRLPRAIRARRGARGDPESFGGSLPADVEILESRMPRREPPGGTGEGGPCFAVEKRRAVTSSDFSAVSVDTEAGGAPVVTFSLQPEAARRLGELTLANLGRVLAFVVDDEAMLAPVIRGPRPRKKRATTNAKLFSLYPLSLEEAVDKLLSVKPEPSRTKGRQKKGTTDNPA